MSDMSTLLGNQAGGKKALGFEHKGQRYEARYIDQTMKADLEALFQERMLRPFMLGANSSGASFERAIELLAEWVGSGKYGFYSEAVQRWITTRDGGMSLARLIFGLSVEAMAVLMREREADVSTIISTVVKRSFRELMPDDGENPPAPSST